MLELNSSLLTVLYTLKSLVLYSLGLTIILSILYLPGMLLFKLFEKKMKFIFAAFLSTYIVTFVYTIIIYFIPFWFLNFKLNGYLDSSNKFVFFLYMFGLFLLYALIITLIAQLFVFLGSYLKERILPKNKFIGFLATMFVISFIIILFFMIFPWFIGGILAMIWF